MTNKSLPITHMYECIIRPQVIARVTFYKSTTYLRHENGTFGWNDKIFKEHIPSKVFKYLKNEST